MQKSDSYYPSLFLSISRGCCFLAGLIGLLVLAGWALDIETLKSILPTWRTVKVNSAIALLLSAISLYLANMPKKPLGQFVAKTFSILVILMGLLTLIEIHFGLDFHIDQTLFKEPASTVATTHPGRMVSSSALSLIFLDLSLFLIWFPRKTRWTQGCIIVPFFLSLLTLTGYLYDASSLYDFGLATPMAFHDAFALLLLCIGVILAQPNFGITKLMAADTIGGALMRKLLPVTLIIPIALDWMSLEGARLGYYNTELGVALFAVFYILIIGFSIYLVGKSAHDADTKRIEFEEKLQSTNKELEAFSYSVSHDLKAPLRIIDGFSMALMEDYEDKIEPQMKEFLNTIRNNTKKMGMLIEDLLNFSRMGKKELVTDKIDMQELAQNVFEELKGSVPERKIQFSLDTLPKVKGDLSMVRQIFTNLFSNSIKYTRPKKEASIDVGFKNAPQNEIIFFVKDNGVGFDMKYSPKLFGVFQRLHGSEEFEGTGVGLALVQRIIHKHGGRIWAESHVNKGATFYFTLQKGETV